MLSNKNLSYRIIVGMMLAMGLLISLVMMVFLLGNIALEHDLMENQNRVELQRLKNEFNQNPDYHLPQTAKLRIYMEDADSSALPAYLRELPIGFNDEIETGDFTYFVLVSQFNDRYIYIVNDISEFEKTENAFGQLILISWIILMVLIFAVSYLLTRHLLKPISDFADEIGQLQPQQRGLKLSGKYHGLEIEKITHAFDQYMGKLDEYVERQRSFSAMASHELRTPLTIVQTSAELISSQTSNNLITDQCNKIIRSTSSMSDMILALLSITRDQPLKDENNKVSLVATVKEALENRKNEIRLNKIEIYIDTDHWDSANDCLQCNSALLSVVLNNLLSNAIKHSPQGLIRITYQHHGLSIEDNGSGVESEDMDQLFKFGVAGKNNGGYGLGLYITWLICQRQGWRIELSHANPGTIAKVTFMG